ncbi:ArsB/NhaD family transporter [Mesobacillus zeae]|uniref:Arsenic transporter n=1 Tax=Mesobacillus zeae TaxID=1917180 RepID=A0A398BLW0_9BACI|nr:ArsB/NhaD family transporter [Mesobacillus zeae]RID88353.1 arsenic transporter [Mesobacillus zeae]
MTQLTIFLTLFAFIFTMVLIFWRPMGINEAIPATIGAVIVLIAGSVTLGDIGEISSKVTGATITIVATMVMAITLESIGFFHWVSQTMLKASNGSGIRLYWLTNLLCFLMTLFLNNDGSILITTPILLLLLKYLDLKNHQMLPYLISGAIIATASSAPIGVSNIVNLISLQMIDMDLYLHTMMMFVPATIGLLFLSSILFALFYKQIPVKLPSYWKNAQMHVIYRLHPLQSPADPPDSKKRSKVMKYVLLYVFLVRVSLFAASYVGVSVSAVAIFGSIALLLWRWHYLKIPPSDMVKKTPWQIFLFAFSMYVIIYGLHNIGLTSLLIEYLEPIVSENLFHATLIMGTLLSLLSNLFNNHPALMVGTLTIAEMGLDPLTLKTIYLANIIGSDIGSLLLPTGTLATLIWMNILRKHKVKVSWSDYVKVTIIAIPISVLFTLSVLYAWIRFIYL